MKKFFAIGCLCILFVLLFGCGQHNENEINLDEMKASDIVKVLMNQGFPVLGGNDYDYPGEYPSSPEGCISAAEFWTPAAPKGTEDGEFTVYVEVYDTVAACKARRDGLVCLSSQSNADIYMIQVEKVFIRVPFALAEQTAAQYQSALEKMADGEWPDLFTAN